MATFTEIRDRLVAVLEQVEGLHVVARPAESPPSVLPSLVIGEPTAQFAEGASTRGLDIWDVPLALLVPMGDYQLASEVLDDYLKRHGTTSIRQVIADNPSLGLMDGTSAFLDRMDEYGPRTHGEQRMAGAVLHLIVRTSG